MDSSSTNENSYIFDPESAAEMARLINQDRFSTHGMGGPLVGLPALSSEAQIIDLGCGPGGWVLDVAFANQDAEVTGVDISNTMVDYAKARARTQRLANASFAVMDITQPLNFADDAFDLVNARFLTGVLKREAWPPFIAECTRILRPGGILRLTEGNEFAVTMSPAFEEITSAIIQAMWRAGYGFSTNGRSWGMSPALSHLLRQAGYKDLHMQSYVTDYSAHTEGWPDYYHNSEIIFYQIKPLLLGAGLMTNETFEQLFHQAIIEMHAEEFSSVAHAITVWSHSPTSQ